MNEPFHEVGSETAPKKKTLDDRMKDLFLGPNEDLILPAFVPYAPRYNLLPAKRPISPLVIAAASVAIAALAVLGPNSVIQWQLQQVQQEIEVQQQLAAQRKREDQLYTAAQKQIDGMLAQKDALEFVTTGTPRWSEILERLRVLTPGGVRFTRLKGASNGDLFLSGEAENLRSIGNLMLNLRGSGYFYKPVLEYSERKGGLQPLTFELSTGIAHGEWLVNPEFAKAASTSAAPR